VGERKSKSTNNISAEAVYAFEVEVSTIRKIICNKKDLEDGVALVEMYIFLRNPCKLYRLM